MADVLELLSEYIAEHRAGGKADPLEYLNRVDGTDRQELLELIDAYLARSPGQEWDPEAFQGSAAQRAADAVTRSLAGSAGWWPTVLPRLRVAAQLKRDEVVARLAEALGAKGREDKVGSYYHAMEHGTLPSEGVSQRVLEALAQIYDSSAERLRELGKPLAEGAAGPAPGAPAMARKAFPDERYAPAAPAEEAADRPEPVAPADRDEIDELFTGGP